MAVAIGGCAPVNVPPLLPGSSYQVTHQIWQRSHIIADVCKFEGEFEGSDGTYIVTHYKGPNGWTNFDIRVPDGPLLLHPLAKITLTDESKKTLGEINNYCLKTEKPEGMSRTTITMPHVGGLGG